MKYAIIESGGKQYKAVEGATIDVDLLDVEIGQQVNLEDVLLVVEDETYPGWNSLCQRCTCIHFSG